MPASTLDHITTVDVAAASQQVRPPARTTRALSLARALSLSYTATSNTRNHDGRTRCPGSVLSRVCSPSAPAAAAGFGMRVRARLRRGRGHVRGL
eukprot:1066392-Rhodomonas_salina.3